MSKIAYITVKSPFGRQESYVLTEMLALKESGANIIIFPRDISHELFHKKAEFLIEDTLIIPWFNIKIAIRTLKYIFAQPISFLKIVKDIAFDVRSARIALKNLIILPKALYLSKIIKENSISHIHAHWGTTTATMAYIISKIAGIPWSLTLHRRDIKENNLLRIKCISASFIRTINEQGRNELLEIVKETSLKEKIFVIHMGVDIPVISRKSDLASGSFTMLCPANFVLKKGHKYLFKACKLLLGKGVKFKLLIAGDGPLENDLKKTVSGFALNDCVEFLGRLPHERVFDLYSSDKINAVVLPSIVTDEGEHEGIPVALMEAMSYGIPVISTDTGGISELIDDGSGIMVKEKDPKGIADAVEKLIEDRVLYEKLSENGNNRIKTSFNVDNIARKLMKLFLESSI